MWSDNELCLRSGNCSSTVGGGNASVIGGSDNNNSNYGGGMTTVVSAAAELATSANGSGSWSKMHLYDGDISDMLKPWKTNPEFYPTIITYSLTFLVGVVGNTIIVFTMAREKSARNATSLFLVSLAVADLLLLLLCVPLESINLFLLSWEQSEALCNISSYAKTLSAVASILNLTAVSFERYVVIVYPMRSRALCTMSNCRKALIGVWLVAFVLSTPSAFTKKLDYVTYFNNVSTITIYYCLESTERAQLSVIISFYQLAIMFALPMLLMTFCYARVIKELWMSTVTMSAMTRINSSARFDSRSSISSSLRNSVVAQHSTTLMVATPTPSSSNNLLHRNSPTRLSGNSDDVRHARKQVIKMLILVIVLFLVCWGPYLILNILQKQGFTYYTRFLYVLRITFILLPFVHSCLNPIIYSIMSSNFRRMMMRTCSNQSCVRHVPMYFCCPKQQHRGSLNGSNGRRILRGHVCQHRSYSSSNNFYDANCGDGSGGGGRGGSHALLQRTCSNTGSSDVRTSPITECESIIHDPISFT